MSVTNLLTLEIEQLRETKMTVIEQTFRDHFQRLKFLYRKLFGEDLLNVGGVLYTRAGRLLTPINKDEKSLIMAIYIKREWKLNSDMDYDGSSISAATSPCLHYDRAS